MKIKYIIILLFLSKSAISQDLKINGILDGTILGAPKMIELYVVNDISDIREYGLGRAPNGSMILNETFGFEPGGLTWTAGTYIYVSSEVPTFTSYFGFAPDFFSSGLHSNGNDVIGLFWDDPGTPAGDQVLIDIFGHLGIDGSGTTWEHTDSWAKRNADNGPEVITNMDGSLSFVESNWQFEPIGVLNSCPQTNSSCTSTYPLGTLPVELINFSID